MCMFLTLYKSLQCLIKYHTSLVTMIKSILFWGFVANIILIVSSTDAGMIFLFFTSVLFHFNLRHVSPFHCFFLTYCVPLLGKSLPKTVHCSLSLEMSSFFCFTTSFKTIKFVPPMRSRPSSS